MKTVDGIIILVDDWPYEKDLIERALAQRNWVIKLAYFSNAPAALDYLRNTNDEIFLIISDMNMPHMNGLEFKRAIDNDPVLMQRSIPFIFASTSASKQQVCDAYEYRLQGYFNKPMNVAEQAEMLDIIIRYWVISRHPNKNDA